MKASAFTHLFWSLLRSSFPHRIFLGSDATLNDTHFDGPPRHKDQVEAPARKQKGLRLLRFQVKDRLSRMKVSHTQELLYSASIYIFLMNKMKLSRVRIAVHCDLCADIWWTSPRTSDSQQLWRLPHHCSCSIGLPICGRQPRSHNRAKIIEWNSHVVSFILQPGDRWIPMSSVAAERRNLLWAGFASKISYRWDEIMISHLQHGRHKNCTKNLPFI